MRTNLIPVLAQRIKSKQTDFNTVVAEFQLCEEERLMLRRKLRPSV